MFGGGVSAGRGAGVHVEGAGAAGARRYRGGRVCGGWERCWSGERWSVRLDASDELGMGVRYGSNGMWGVRAVGRGAGEDGTRGCVRWAGGVDGGVRAAGHKG